MRSGLAVLGAALALIGAECRLAGAGDPGFVSLFDGKSLKGWEPQHTDRFHARDGVIVNDGGTGWMRSTRSYRDFEFQAEYRVIKPGSDSGIFFRASAESMPKEPFWSARCYQLQVIDAPSNGMFFGHGLAPPRFERKADALKSASKDAKQWQRIRLKVVGSRAEVALNDVVVTTSEAIQVAEGHIGLQGENGHIEWRALKIREFPGK
jgi:Domain of Unknown Function (DUF1080)